MTLAQMVRLAADFGILACALLVVVVFLALLWKAWRKRVADRFTSIPGKPIILNGSIRYGVSRNCPATDGRGRQVKLAIAVIERDNGAAGTTFETVAIDEEKIRFAGESIIEQEVKRVMGL